VAFSPIEADNVWRLGGIGVKAVRKKCGSRLIADRPLDWARQ